MALEGQSRYSIDADWNKLYIDGEWIESESGESTPVEDPSTREVVTEVPRGTEGDVDAAYEAAVEAQAEWGEQPPAAREELVQGLIHALDEHQEEIIELITTEIGGIHGVGETSVQIILSGVSYMRYCKIISRQRWIEGPTSAPG